MIFIFLFSVYFMKYLKLLVFTTFITLVLTGIFLFDLNKTLEWDTRLFREVNSISFYPLDRLMCLITHLGSILFISLVTVFLVVKKKLRSLGLMILFSLVIYIMISWPIKALVHRERPAEVLSNIKLMEKTYTPSFPSGHSGTLFMLATLLYPRKKLRKWLILVIPLAIIIPFSRIYIGVHFPTDVIYGSLIGIISGLLTLSYFEARRSF